MITTTNNQHGNNESGSLTCLQVSTWEDTNGFSTSSVLVEFYQEREIAISGRHSRREIYNVHLSWFRYPLFV